MKHLRTYRLVPTDDPPVIGEIRYAVWLTPLPGEELANMMPVEQRVIWTGTEWLVCQD